MDKKFLHKVVNQLVNETKIDYERERIDLTSSATRWSFPPLSIPAPVHLPSYTFYNHCKDMYGLTSEETEYVWMQYRKVIKDKIKKTMNINESAGTNQKDYLDKVINQLVTETEIDYENTEIDAPFLFTPLLGFSSTSFPSFASATNFFKYCRNIYGLTEEETEYVWIQYRKTIKDKIKNKPLNESTEDNALNKIVDQLMDETDIDYGRKLVLTPFWVRPFVFPFSIASRSFIRHCRDIYGLNDPETQYVWDKYKKIIKYKIKNG